jgi:hypothetical protein
MMKPLFALLVLATVLLTSCNLPGGSDTANPTPPVLVDPAAPDVPLSATSAPANSVYLPQNMREGVPIEVPPPLTFFWLDGSAFGLVAIPDRSYADSDGFSLELEKPGVSLVLMGGDVATAAWDAAVANGAPQVVRGQQGYAFTPPSGVSLHWFENGNYYLVSTIGMSVDEVQALLNTLQTVNQSDFQARLTP